MLVAFRVAVEHRANDQQRKQPQRQVDVKDPAPGRVWLCLRRDNPGDAITQQHGWPGHLYSGSDTEEKPGPDSAPEGDKLNMTVLQTAMQRRILFRRGFSSTIA
jgi:hypothetical protein